MTTDKPPSAYARIEAGSRQMVMQIGLGVVAFVLGSVLSVGATARLGERLGTLDSDWSIFAFRWIFERLWLFVMLPVFGYAIGRFTEIKPSRFALTAGLSGETFSVLLVTAINGFDSLLEDPYGLVARGLTLFVGLVITTRVAEAGRAESEAAQLAANTLAEARKAEYASFLAAAEGKKEAPAPSEIPPVTPSAVEGPKVPPVPLPEAAPPLIEAAAVPVIEVPAVPLSEASPVTASEGDSPSPLPDPLPRGGEGGSQS